MSHEVFSIVAHVHPARVHDLERLLDRDGTASQPIPGLPLDRIPAIHFASFVVFRGRAVTDTSGGEVRTLTPRPMLVFESAIDGPLDDYLDALAALGAPALAAIFAHCIDPPGASPAEIRAYLRSHLLRPHLWHIGNPGLRTDHVGAGAALRARLDADLDTIVRHGRGGDPPERIRAELRARLRVPPSDRRHWHLTTDSSTGAGGISWFADPVPRWRSRLWHWTRLLLFVLLVLAPFVMVFRRGAMLAAIAVAAAVLAGVAFWLWLLGRHPPPVEDPVHIQGLKELEDVGVQNHMASLILLKRGLLRQLSIRLVLSVFNLSYRTVFTDVTPGRILGLATIHFAQWSIVPLVVEDDRGRVTRREGLMFLSNYDGSWDTYLDDFVDVLGTGVKAIWANAVGFPSPLDGAVFKAWARTCMSRWHYWYRRHPDLTVLNIEGNDAIRKGLLPPVLPPHDARLWLARFGSLKTGHEDLPEPKPALESADIQGLVLTGYRHLTEAEYLLLRIEDHAKAELRAWLARVAPVVGDARPRTKAELAHERARLNLAFTFTGLQALGVPDAVLGRFPLVFREGMAPPGLSHRSRALGDTDESAPEAWTWGAPASRVDLVVMVFARDRDALAAALAAHVTPLIDGQIVSVVQRLASRLPEVGQPIREPFGFVDGLSQPIIEGSVAAAKVPVESALHLVKPGEFVLGYPNRDGIVTPGVPLDPDLDGLGLLPFDPTGTTRLRDLGHNGSYLVIRQLAQDVAAFRREMQAAESPEALAARVVGRWRDGTPLAGGPAATPRENDFTYTGDPHGFACPVGAHIRRANPRDSLLPDPEKALHLANRHRLLRRGRPYRDPDDSCRDAGMMFLCFNSDIERQFEFVQQNWIGNPTFGGVYDEADPMLGSPGRLTVQRNGVRERYRFATPPRFVTVKGGAYFFMPGLSALRYLANLEADAAAGLPMPAPPSQHRAEPVRLLRPSWARRALGRLERAVSALSVAWAVRYPAAVAAALVVLAWAPSVAPALGTNLFLTDAAGVAIVAALSSLTAFVVMITLRLVLLYGWRNGLRYPRWAARARWLHVLAFQTLALPLIVTSIHRSAVDAAQQPWTWAYWTRVLDLSTAAGLGLFGAFLTIGLATGVQALQAAARPDLFIPPNPLLSLAGRTRQWPRLRALSAWLARLGEWCVNVVPEPLGTGYIDYRERRILPGHVFAGVLGVVVILAYVAGALALNPAWTTLAGRVPPIAYIVFVLMIAGWWLSAAAFFLDRYRVPAIVVVAAWLVLIASTANTDHYFRVGPPVDHPPLSPTDVVTRAHTAHPGRPIIIVTSEGLGLLSSAWTAEVLTRLSQTFGRAFTDSLRLASVSSGASLGVAFFLAEYGPEGFPLTDETFDRVRRRARTAGSSENAWGLVYPDLVRTIAPPAVPRLADRGWALEQTWRRALGASDPTLASWRAGVSAGWRPASAFGVTVVESGQRAVLATYDSPGAVDLTGKRDLSILTAARLAASFPFVTPMPRADIPAAAAGYHVTDGGYWDNFGIVEAVEWLADARAAIGRRPVLIIEIRSSAPRRPPLPEDRAWTLDLIGPLRALTETRLDAQPSRNATDLALLDRWWGPTLHHAVFTLGGDSAPLTWNLGQRDLRAVTEAWSSTANVDSQRRVGAFLEGR